MNVTSRLRTIATTARVIPAMGSADLFCIQVKMFNIHSRTYYWRTIEVSSIREEAELQHAQLIMGTHEKYVLKPK